MKKLLLTTLMLTSLNSYSQEGRQLIIENSTYKNQSMTLECLDTKCSLISLDNKSIYEMSTINETIKNRRGYTKYYNQYPLTKKVIKNINTNISEGYNFDAVGNSFIGTGALAIDSIIAAPKALTQILTKKTDSIKDKRAARRIKRNLLSDQGIMKIKHKYFHEIKDYLDSIYTTSNKDIPSAYRNFLTNVFVCKLKYKKYSHLYSHYVEASDTENAKELCKEYVQKSYYDQFIKLGSGSFIEYVKRIRI